MLLKSMGVEHLNIFQGLVLEFKRRISETLNFMSPTQSKCVGGFCLKVRFSALPLRLFRYPAPKLYLAPTKSHSQLVRNGHWAGTPCWNPKLGCPPRSLHPGHETPWNTTTCYFAFPWMSSIYKMFSCESRLKLYYVHKENSVYV